MLLAPNETYAQMSGEEKLWKVASQKGWIFCGGGNLMSQSVWENLSKVSLPVSGFECHLKPGSLSSTDAAQNCILICLASLQGLPFYPNPNVSDIPKSIFVNGAIWTPSNTWILGLTRLHPKQPVHGQHTHRQTLWYLLQQLVTASLCYDGVQNHKYIICWYLYRQK